LREIKITEENIEALTQRYKWRCSRCGKLPDIGEIWIRTRTRMYCPKCVELVFLDLPDVSDDELEKLEVAFMPLEMIAAWRGKRRK